MTQMEDTDKFSLAGAMLSEFEREVVKTRRFLERVPEDRLSWTPHPKSMTAGQLALHIAEVPSGVMSLVVNDRITPPNTNNRQQAASIGEVLKALDRGAAQVRSVLSTATDSWMRSVFTIDLPDGSKIDVRRVEFLRAILLNHWYHHRGQIGVYLRLMGASVPSAYGPSGDELGGL